MRMTFAEMVTQDIRLVILRCIADDGYSLNESILQSALEMYGHNVSRDRVRTEMRWLEEQGLLGIEDVEGVLVARLTGRGDDCAHGRCKIDGVRAPRPKG